MSDRERIVAVSFLTREELGLVGHGLKRVYHVENDDLTPFADLLQALDRVGPTAAKGARR